MEKSGMYDGGRAVFARSERTIGKKERGVKQGEQMKR